MAFLANSLLESRLLFVLKFPSVSFEIFILQDIFSSSFDISKISRSQLYSLRGVLGYTLSCLVNRFVTIFPSYVNLIWYLLSNSQILLIQYHNPETESMQHAYRDSSFKIMLMLYFTNGSQNSFSLIQDTASISLTKPSDLSLAIN